MSKPALVALHRDVQVLGCGCDGCKGLSESEYVAETRASLEAALPPQVPDPGEVPEHEHVLGEVVDVAYSHGVPYAVRACAICGTEMNRR